MDFFGTVDLLQSSGVIFLVQRYIKQPPCSIICLLFRAIFRIFRRVSEDHIWVKKCVDLARFTVFLADGFEYYDNLYMNRTNTDPPLISACNKAQIWHHQFDLWRHKADSSWRFSIALCVFNIWCRYSESTFSEVEFHGEHVGEGFISLCLIVFLILAC